MDMGKHAVGIGMIGGMYLYILFTELLYIKFNTPKLSASFQEHYLGPFILRTVNE